MIIRVSILSILLVLVGCAGTTPIPKDHYYRLPEPTVAPTDNEIFNGTIFVEQFIADGLYRERAILFSEDTDKIELEQYHYHHWIDSPSRLLRDQLIDCLRASDVATQVTDAADIPAQVLIYGKIKGLEQMRNNGKNIVSVSLEFRVDKEGTSSPLLINVYSEEIDVDDQSMKAVVVAFDKALSNIYTKLFSDIKHKIL